MPADRGYTYTVTRGSFRERLPYLLRILRVLARTDFKIKYAGSVLGYVWSVAKPLLYFVVLWVVFAKVFQASVDRYPALPDHRHRSLDVRGRRRLGHVAVDRRPRVGPPPDLLPSDRDPACRHAHRRDDVRSSTASLSSSSLRRARSSPRRAGCSSSRSSPSSTSTCSGSRSSRRLSTFGSGTSRTSGRSWRSSCSSRRRSCIRSRSFRRGSAR